MVRKKIWKLPPQKDKNIFESIVKNRKLKKDFFNPTPPEELAKIILKKEPLLERNIHKAIKLISEHIKSGRDIYIHGDYDVDGICSTAIMWETIFYGLNYKNCLPYIPDRFSEGYGLSKESIDNIASKSKKGLPLIITVDCGIVSNNEVEYAKGKNISIIISDHHQKGKTTPKADAIIWTDKLCGAGISWLVSTQISKALKAEDYLDLATLATIADLQPLTKYNRSLVKHGLLILNKSKRLGISALINVSGLLDKKIGVYEIGWIMAPRLNASGRLESAMESLRLLCTKNYGKAQVIAEDLNDLNLERQKLTFSTFEESKMDVDTSKKIILSRGSNFHEGIIGLVAGKLSQEYYLPAVVISERDGISKGSARSIKNVNIIEFLRDFEDMFESLGGHPMAAGFSIRSERVEEFKELLFRNADKKISEDDIIPEIELDGEISFKDITFELLDFLISMEPFGLGNAQPAFCTKNVKILSKNPIGKNGNHTKLLLEDKGVSLNALLFNGETDSLGSTDVMDIAYTLNENTWGSRRGIDLIIKDLRPKTYQTPLKQ